ncbi:hypothetical protein SCHPADRAFT_821630 [Schizopora paradoxa]|uniref:Uncharacterized protein n=1 Tax=Schizopora paradoxa TaxID=27342 RepID=A0A0H2RZU7_9AGAM|nr:hypothetical protein SCHPADRAFT_821630 [Schizopora paradoxa]
MSPVSVPWPAQTPHPTASSSSSPISVQKKGKRAEMPSRTERDLSLYPRGIANQSQIGASISKAECFDSSNAVYSCWPLNSTFVNQSDSTQFVWNSNQPSFRQFNLVDIALIRADTGRTVTSFLSQTNPTNRAGSIPLTVDDPWWGSDGSQWDGTPLSFPFYFLVDTSGDDFRTAQPQATFTAVQTTFASSVLASMSSASAAAAASSSSLLASESSASAASSSSGANSGSTNPSSLQNGSGGSSSFPHWAIAVITILGFFALLAFAMLVFLVCNRARKDRENHPTRRGSTGSQSPIMTKDVGGGDLLSSPPAKEAALGAGIGAAGAYSASEKDRAHSFVSPDGASTHSDTPFSGADAAVMAEAFRKALRKPDFAAQPVEEGESPSGDGDQPELLNRELAEEGRDLRSVGSSRGVRVETLSPDEHEGDPPTEHDSML